MKMLRKIRYQWVLVAILLIIAYSYFQSGHFYVYKMVYNISDFAYWAVVGLICIYILQQD